MVKGKKDRQHNDQRKEGQTTQWSKERRTDNTLAKGKKDRKHSGQRKEGHKGNNDLQKTTHKTKDRVTQTSLKTRGELKCSGRVSIRQVQLYLLVYFNVAILIMF